MFKKLDERQLVKQRHRGMKKIRLLVVKTKMFEIKNTMDENIRRED